MDNNIVLFHENIMKYYDRNKNNKTIAVVGDSSPNPSAIFFKYKEKKNSKIAIKVVFRHYSI